LALALAAGGAASAQETAQPNSAAPAETAIFAGGCFWCVEEAFDKLPGVVATTSGYTGGTVANPTYDLVSAGDTGHFEAVKVDYDPAKVKYEQLLDAFWKNVDPFDAKGQFCDKGQSYLSSVFVGGDEEKQAAEASKQRVTDQFKMPVATTILPERNSIRPRSTTRITT
jgi:peptide-methionine (S)-S-oxide reductase